MSNMELNAKINDLRELYRMADELENEIDAIHSEIKNHMDAAGVDTVNGTNYKITYKPVTTNRIDTTALKKHYPELAARFVVTRTARRLVII